MSDTSLLLPFAMVLAAGFTAGAAIVIPAIRTSGGRSGAAPGRKVRRPR